MHHIQELKMKISERYVEEVIVDDSEVNRNKFKSEILW